MFDYERYKDGNEKFRLKAKYEYDLPSCFGKLKAKFPEGSDAYVMLVDRRLTMRKEYAWNGANYFPDFRWALRATLVHDALCQLIKEGAIAGRFRECADRELYCIVAEDKGVRWASTMYSAIRGHETVAVCRRSCGWCIWTGTEAAKLRVWSRSSAT